MSIRAGILVLALLAVNLSFASLVSTQLTTQSCDAENSSTLGSFGIACNGVYPSSCGAGGDLLSCNDGFAENHTISNGNGYGGVRSTQFDTGVTDCLSVVSVSMCYEWWASTTNLDPSGCRISVSNDSGSTYSLVTTACPGTTANPGMTCTNVTSNASWSCQNFFGPSGSRSQIRSELRKNTGAGGSQTAAWDVLFFNVTYLAPTPVAACTVIGSPGAYKLTSDLSGAPNPGSSVAINACVLINTDNVSLDCNGFGISNNGTAGSTSGILVENARNVTLKNCPSVSSYTHGIYIQASNDSAFSNITSFNDSILAFSIVQSRNDTLTGITAYNSSDGISLSGSSNNTLIGNNVYNITNTGIQLSSSSSLNLVTSNTVSNSSVGIEANSVSDNDVAGNSLDNDQTGVLLDFGSSGNRIWGNNATFSPYGFFLTNASGNNLTGNLASGSATGFYLYLSSGNLLSGNNATGSSNEGFFLITGSSGNTLSNDIAINGINRGFRFQDGANGNALSNVIAADNNDTNYVLSGSDNNNISDFLSSNAPVGVDLEDSNNTVLSGGVIANSTSYGILIADSDGTVITGGRTYNNNPDLAIWDVFLPSPVSLSLSNIFDSPSGSLSNYTNISVTDSVGNGTGYSMNWSAPVLPLPPSYFSFGEKFLNVTNLTGGVSIDNLVWRWLDSEPGASSESNFRLWKYGQAGWSLVNGTPDTAANTLSLTDQGNFSVFAILVLNDTTPPSVSLSSPPSGSSVNSTSVNFTFTTADDFSTSMNCSLSIDGTLNQTNSSVANNTPTTFTASGLQMGNHTWNVTCMDSSGNAGASASWNFFEYAVSSCPVITVPGTYLQAANLLGAPNPLGTPSQSGFSSVCVKIAASNTAYDCGGYNITNNGVNNAMGVYINGSISNVTLENCGISLYKRGATVQSTLDSVISGNSFLNNTQDGLLVSSSSNATFIGNTAANNSQNGVEITGGGNNAISGNVFNDNKGSGIDLLSSPNNNFTSNTADGNSLEGIHVASSDNNLFWGNTIIGNKQDGIQVVTNTNNTFVNNLADNNTQHGLHIVGTVTNLFINNTMDYNTQDGMHSASSFSSSFINNTACYNGQSGYVFASSSVDAMTGNTACSNPQNGIFIDDSNLTTLSGNHYFNNTLDFTMTSTSLKVINTTYEIFDNPLDSFQNYTNLSVNDSEAGATFSISWSPPPASLPTGCPVFGNKFVNITNSSGNVSIDSITWHWDANETAGLNLSLFHLAVFNGSAWTAVNGQSLDAPSNSLTVGNLSQFGVMSIMMCNDSASALKLSQTVLPLSPGGLAQFSIFLNNTGGTILEPALAVDTLPAGLTFLSASPAPSGVSGQMVTWNDVGPLAPGASATILVNATADAGIVSASSPNVTLTNVVNAIGTDPINLNVSANSSADVTVLYANISVSKAVNQTNAAVNKDINYTLNISNTGAVNLTVSIVDTLPPNMTFFGSDVAPASNSSGAVSWDVAGLEPGASILIHYVVRVGSTGTFINSVNATGAPPNGDNVSGTATTTLLVSSAPYNPPGGGGGSPALGLSLSSSCAGNVLTVSDSHGPVSGAHVSVNGGSAFVGLTNASGQVAFPGCDLNISARATDSGHLPASLGGQAVSCLSCVPQCTDDSGCQGSERCSAGICAPVSCPNGTVADHQCVAPPANQTQCVSPGCCTSDLQCLDTQACVSPSGAPASPSSPGSCRGVTGQCGNAQNHTFVPYGYECGSEAGCPTCPQGLACIDHACISRKITCPSSGFIGTSSVCHATQNNESCRYCDLNITRPDGVTSGAMTDGAGNFSLGLDIAGVYNISILANGSILHSAQVASLLPPQPQEPAKPSIFDICPWPLWILLIILIIAAIIYWRRRKKAEEQPERRGRK